MCVRACVCVSVYVVHTDNIYVLNVGCKRLSETAKHVTGYVLSLTPKDS